MKNDASHSDRPEPRRGSRRRRAGPLAAASRPKAISAAARGPARLRWIPGLGSARPGRLASFFMASLP